MQKDKIKNALIATTVFLLVLPIIIADECSTTTKVFVLGDSITMHGGKDYGYVMKLKSKCGATFASRGFSGKRSDYIASQFDMTVPSNNNILIIEAGVNDLREGKPASHVIQHITSMINKAKGKNMKVILLTTVPWKDHVDPSEPNTKWTAAKQAETDKFNAWVKTNPLGITSVDIYKALESSSGSKQMAKSDHVGDNLHPNAAGHKKIADAISAVFKTGGNAGSAGTGTTGTAGTTTTSGNLPIPASCTPQSFKYGTISNKIFDLVITTDEKETKILGIARQPIAVGLDKKKIPELGKDFVCKPVPAQKNIGQEFLKATYGNTQMNVEAQLQEIEFLKSLVPTITTTSDTFASTLGIARPDETKISLLNPKIKIHKKIVPAVLCVQKEIQDSCPGIGDFKLMNLRGYEWSVNDKNPEILPSSSYGISVDVNPPTDSMPKCIVDAFKKYGFRWGGEFKEPMIWHFEFMSDPNLLRTGTAQQLAATGGGGGPETTTTAIQVDSKYSVKADDPKFTCSYCGDMKAEYKKLFPNEELKNCKGWLDCCEGKCPPGSYINPTAKYYSQTDKKNYPMPADCVVQPTPPKKQYTYGNIGCATFSWRMALSAYGIEKSAKDVFCGKLSNIAVFPGFGGSLKSAHKKAGVGLKIVPFDWNAVVAEVKQGYPLIWDINDKNIALDGRCKNSKTSQHFMVAIGASDDYLIINDPGNWCGYKFSERMVINKDYFMQASKHKVMYIIYPPEQKDVHDVKLYV